MTLSIMTLIIMAFDAECCYTDSHLCSVAFMLSVASKITSYDACHYAECRYAEYRYAECRGAVFGTDIRFKLSHYFACRSGASPSGAPCIAQYEMLDHRH